MEYQISWVRKNGRSKNERRNKHFRSLNGVMNWLDNKSQINDQLIDLRTEQRTVEYGPWEEM